jgi:hypothetical protein
VSAPKEILRLIGQFGQNLDSYKSGQYNETQLRREFLDPFFRALGWDMDNTQGLAEAYKDVVNEDAIRIGGAVKAPDYCFRIGGTRKFFLEAKKPSVAIGEEITAAYQLRRYAWSAKLPLSILSDFEEFAVYDCRIKPNKSDSACTARVFICRFQDYPDRWDWISSVFSKEAVLKGSFDKYAETNKTKRGTSEVDDDFLVTIEHWRSELARNIALRNAKLSQRELNFCVQRIIDRIIFLRICEDRGMELYGRLLALTNGPNIYGRLCEMFEDADAKYNSGLFYFQAEKGRREPPDEITLSLEVDDKLLQDLLKGLYYPESPYEFTVLSADILGQVYEQFLGKVIRLTAGHHAVIEDKPEVKKAGGVYYTPTYIVDYIVRQTVGKIVEGKTPRQVAKFRVLDPACGSGSFLINAYQFLLDWHHEWYLAHQPERWAKGRNPALVQAPSGWKLTIEERKRILLDDIYGVDIDPQAVEVTKLSLLLKVLEGESEQTVQPYLRLFHKRALPDLGGNIKCGNSLIGPDFYQQKELPLLSDEDRLRVNVFDWTTEFPEIMRSGGFDAVIGNPPYIRIQRIDHIQSDYFYKSFRTPMSKTDLSQLFLEKSLSLVKIQGLIGFVCSSQWIYTDYGINMRRVLSQGILREIVDFGSLPVFKKASTYPAIFILSRTLSHTLSLIRVNSPDQLNIYSIEQIQPRELPLPLLADSPWSFVSLNLQSVLIARSIDFSPLRVFGKAMIGDLTGMDEAFVLYRAKAIRTKLEKDLLYPYAYRGNEINRYEYVYPKSVVIYPYKESINGQPEIIPEEMIKKDFPKTYQHLIGYKDELRQRKDSRRLYATGSDWYRHLRPGTFKLIHPKKLAVRGIGKNMNVGLLPEKTIFNGANCPCIILADPGEYSYSYFLGILNSKLISWHLKAICPPKLAGYTRFTAKKISEIPIRKIDFSSLPDTKLYNLIVGHVEKIIKLHKLAAQTNIPHEKEAIRRQIDATDKQINGLVYELYDLTREEINVVEESD